MFDLRPSSARATSGFSAKSGGTSPRNFRAPPMIAMSSTTSRNAVRRLSDGHRNVGRVHRLLPPAGESERGSWLAGWIHHSGGAFVGSSSGSGRPRPASCRPAYQAARKQATKKPSTGMAARPAGESYGPGTVITARKTSDHAAEQTASQVADRAAMIATAAKAATTPAAGLTREMGTTTATAATQSAMVRYFRKVILRSSSALTGRGSATAPRTDQRRTPSRTSPRPCAAAPGLSL